MGRLSVYFLTLVFCFHVAAKTDDLDDLRENHIFQMKEKSEGEGHAIFTVDSHSSTTPLVFEVEGQCNNASRVVEIRGNALLSLLPQHFTEGSVRQYVIYQDGEETGRIKIDSEPCVATKNCPQPRIRLTDPSDRILAEIAPAENELKQIIVRDNLSQIVVHAELKDGVWKVRFNDVEQVSAAFLVVASRLERDSCLRTDPGMINLKRIAIVSTLIAVVFGTVFVFFRK